MERRFAGLGVIAILLVAWECTARWIIPALKPSLSVLIPPPSEVLKAGFDLARSGELLAHVLVSSKRVLIAWALVVATAVSRWDGLHASSAMSIRWSNFCALSRRSRGYRSASCGSASG
jgi:ABC-type nitrate/sulfonate/bicarbonate transport system permease component